MIKKDKNKKRRRKKKKYGERKVSGDVVVAVKAWYRWNV
jgi:hypothetical protein